MYLKMMGPDDALPDRHPSRTYRMVHVVSVEFGHHKDVEEKPFSFADVVKVDGAAERLVIRGRAFLLNQDGHTIDSFAELAAAEAADARHEDRAAHAAG